MEEAIKEKEMEKKEVKFFSLVRNLQNVPRWGGNLQLIKDDVSQHSFRVCIIAYTLAVIKNVLYGGNLNSERLAMTAAFHDLSESQLNQDIIYSLKTKTPELYVEIKKVEEKAERECVASLPLALAKEFSPLIVHDQVPEEYRKIIKVSDLVDAFLHAKSQNNDLTPHFRELEQELEQRIAEYKVDMPELEYFLEHCVDADRPKKCSCCRFEQ